jgi:hypothetical protein
VDPRQLPFGRFEFLLDPVKHGSCDAIPNFRKELHNGTSTAHNLMFFERFIKRYLFWRSD